ncbi:MAG TPA: 2-C-methyl-D-erythritol 4-phosphate cytidylyltransferase [Steroidobacteraceae bacterium]|nr:2-C-methyl-D-erythritol 4-phosphate cytidylyltransferase [Steroidobacteraceae bacterium]
MSGPEAARRVFAVVPAAGRGERFDPGGKRAPKQYTPLFGSTVLEWALRPLLAEPRIERVVVVVAADDLHWSELARAIDHPKLATAIGGASRQESVMSGLKGLGTLARADDWVLVHDAARPCLEAPDVKAVVDALDGEACGAVLATPVVDTVKRERDGLIGETVDRRGLWRALTPQVFPLGALERALAQAERGAVSVTDEAQAMERLGLRPRLVQGSPLNIKITRASDLDLAERILASAESAAMRGRMRIGQGFDVHAFGAGDHVMLGGVRVAHHRGVVAHSDGDVVIHALCDALLGALGAGDIGKHFPDSDPRYKGADSRLFLRTVAGMMRSAGWRLINADVTVLAEAPRIASHRAAIAANLAADLGTSAECINIKATTTERLGFIGRGEGLAAQAGVLLGAANATGS